MIFSGKTAAAKKHTAITCYFSFGMLYRKSSDQMWSVLIDLFSSAECQHLPREEGQIHPDGHRHVADAWMRSGELSAEAKNSGKERTLVRMR